MRLTGEAWLLGHFQEEKPCSRLPSVLPVMNAGDRSVGGEAGSPRVLPGGRMRNRTCPASHFSWAPLADTDMPRTALQVPASLRESKAGTLTWEAASKLTVWLQLFPLTSLACLLSGVKRKMESM